MPALGTEVARLVRSNPLACVDIPDALNFLVGDRLDPAVRRDLKVRSNLKFLQDITVHVRSVSFVVVLGPTNHCHLILRTPIPQ